jgi:pimeloyl-ACP methyl ester carboxylesterase
MLEMPFVEVRGKKMFYEAFGEGEPLFILNGIMMSTASWYPYKDVLSKYYRMIVVDLLEMGKSDKADGPFTQDMHVEMFKEFLDKLGCKKIHLFGVSYGGEVSQLFAIKYQEMLHTLILANTTSETNNIMKDIEEGWDYALGTHNGDIFWSSLMPYVYSVDFYRKDPEWLKGRRELFKKVLAPEWYDSIRKLSASAHNFNCTKDLHKIGVPTLIISTDLDILTPPAYQEVIHNEIKGSKWIVIKGGGHGAVYENALEYALLMIGFLKTYDIPIPVK